MTGKLNIHAQEKICMEWYFCTFLSSQFYTVEEGSSLLQGTPELVTGSGIQEFIVNNKLETESRGIMRRASSTGLSTLLWEVASKSGIFERESLT